MPIRHFLSLAKARFAPSAGWSPVTVRALGPLEIWAGNTLVSRIGGDHAGSSQALALLAVLFDRGAAGVAKDEIIDLLWPESDLAHADLSFHRTLGGLRRALAPERPLDAIQYRSRRYRLAPDLVANSDVIEFEVLLSRAALATGDDRIWMLEEAVRLYRGDYLDDCPYYGDSAQVEARRQALRRTYLQANEELTAAYAEGGHTSLGLLRAFEAQRFAPLNGGWVISPTRVTSLGDGAPRARTDNSPPTLTNDTNFDRTRARARAEAATPSRTAGTWS